MKNKFIKFYSVLTIAIIHLYSINFALASESPCIDNALTVADVINCGNALALPLEADIELEYKRLFEKFKNNKEMQTMLQLSKEGWSNSQNLQCRMEELIADGGKMVSPRTVEAEKTFLRCLLRMRNEQKSALSKL